MLFRRLVRNPDVYISGLLLIYLLLGLIVTPDYGQSWDERARYRYGKSSLAAYVGGAADLTDEKGAFFSMVGVLGAEVFKRVVPGWETFDGWHFVTFLSFLMGIFFFHRLCRRLVDPWPAFGATLLFSTQPLIWGHSFINPKDIPFMAFFTASVSLGLDMVDRFREKTVGQIPPPGAGLRARFFTGLAALKASWRAAPGWVRFGLPAVAVVFLALVFYYSWLAGLVTQGVQEALSGAPASWSGVIFSRFIASGGDVAAQTSLVLTGFSWFFLALEGVLLLAFLLLGRRAFPVLFDEVFIAGCILGLCSDIRTLGPASGLLVMVYFFSKSGFKSIPVLLKYLAVAALVMYAFWPALWGSPLTSYIGSIAEAQDFDWEGNVMFEGDLFSKASLPARFLPTLLALQFTEPAMLLILAGVALACLSLVRKPALRMDVLLLGAWFLAPVGAAILLHSTVYNNFRQFLFAIPPLFILAALALQWFWSWSRKRPAWFLPLVGLVLIPSVYWNLALHPYEYIYYNSLAGNVSGAFRRYEMDYWCTAYKDATLYLNQVAPQGAVVSVSGPYWIMTNYARPDLKFYLQTERSAPDPDYAVLSSKWNYDTLMLPDEPVVFQIEREGAILAVVKEVGQ